MSHKKHKKPIRYVPPSQRPKAEPCPPETLSQDDPRVQPDYTRSCSSCGAKPVLPLTGMCGPCSFGEAETAGGNW